MEQGERELPSSSNHKQTFVRDYFLAEKEEVYLRIHQDPLALWAAGVGATVWDAALVLAKYLESTKFPPGFFAHCRTVEVGAGTGIVGLVLASMGARVALTDRECSLPLLRHCCFDAHNQAILRQERERVFSNAPKGKAKKKNSKLTTSADTHGGCSVDVLQWGCSEHVQALQAQLARDVPWPQTQGKGNNAVDMVVVSDCVYWPDLHEALVETLRQLCEPQTLLLISYEVRKPEVEERFLELLREAFTLEQVAMADIPADFRTPDILVLKGRLRATTAKTQQRLEEVDMKKPR